MPQTTFHKLSSGSEETLVEEKDSETSKATNRARSHSVTFPEKVTKAVAKIRDKVIPRPPSPYPNSRNEEKGRVEEKNEKEEEYEERRRLRRRRESLTPEP